MPTFPAPRPLTVVIDHLAGSVQVTASPRDDAVVTVLPSSPGRTADARLAQETTVDLANDVLTVSHGRTLRQRMIGPQGSITVTIEVPTGSDLGGKFAVGPLYTEGPLGAVTVTSAAGNVSVDQATRLDLRAAAGSIVVGRVTGPTTARASAGSIRIREILADATIRSSSGDVTIGSLTGAPTVTDAHGGIVVGRVSGTLRATTSSGGIRVDSLDQGAATLETAYGSLEVGVPEGTAAWVDATTKHGHVHNRLTPSAAPAADDPGATAEIRATTTYGDVVVRRPESTSPFTGV